MLYGGHPISDNPVGAVPVQSAQMITNLTASTTVSATRTLVTTLMSSLIFTDSFATTLVKFAEFITNVTASDQYSLKGVYKVEFITSLLADDKFFAFIADAEPGALDQSSQVWVINLDTGATSQYENYGFNSFFEDGGEYYGVADDGIYHLTGDDDNSMTINSLIEFGKHDLDSPRVKNVANFYLGLSSSGKVFLKVNADGNEYLYEARASSTDMKHQRVDVGKGLRGVYWKPTLISDVDFELETITFQPFNTSRKF